jgi:hypothetical protein
MAAINQQPLATTYSVEVSGWDHSHVFFVERSELSWSEETGKLLTLSRRLPAGAMIFVRLLQPADGERAFPVAYETEALSSASERSQQFRITRVVPRCVPAENA